MVALVSTTVLAKTVFETLMQVKENEVRLMILSTIH